MSIGSARYQSFRVTGDCRLPLQLEAHREELELISCMLQDHSDEEYCLSAEMGYMHVDSLGDEFYTALICPIYHHKERTKCYLEIGSNGIQLCFGPVSPRAQSQPSLRFARVFCLVFYPRGFDW